MSDNASAGSPVARAVAALLAELWSMLVFTLFGPRTNDHRNTAEPKSDHRGDSERRNAARDRGVTTLSAVRTDAEDPLETSPAKPHLGGRTREGGRVVRLAQGPEDDVSDDFLKQLEQRTEQVKITLANLEAEKIRIESQISALQPLVPQYDALIEAERSLSQASITFETPEDTPPPHLAAGPQESSGWSSDAPGGEEGGQGPQQEQSSGWSGSWNS